MISRTQVVVVFTALSDNNARIVCSETTSIGRRAHPEGRFEATGKIIAIIEARVEGNFRDSSLVLPEQLRGKLQSGFN